MVIAATPLVCAVGVALLAAPSPSSTSLGVPSPVGSSFAAEVDSVAVAEAVALVVGPSSLSGRALADDAARIESPGGVDVSDVVMVLNDDGSAALSATFQGRGAELALMSVHLESDAGALAVASTQMWLPIQPDMQTRAGDASDAGGFIVPTGLSEGEIVHVQFQFDDDTCLSIDAPTIRRNSTHDRVFPIDGDQLGPAAETAADPSCSTV